MINLPKPYCTLREWYMCMHHSIYAQPEIALLHTSARIYRHTRMWTRLRQSLQLNWAFVKALIGPFWPNYHTLIKINPNGSSKYTKRAVCKWLLFTPPPLILLFYFKIIKFCFSIPPATLPESPTYRFENIEILFLQRAQPKKKKINLQMASINLLLGLCTKYQTHFFFLNKAFLLEGGQKRGKKPHDTNNLQQYCYMHEWVPVFWGGFLPLFWLKKKKLI